MPKFEAFSLSLVIRGQGACANVGISIRFVLRSYLCNCRRSHAAGLSHVEILLLRDSASRRPALWRRRFLVRNFTPEPVSGHHVSLRLPKGRARICLGQSIVNGHY